jgi:hypothetical protein
VFGNKNSNCPGVAGWLIMVDPGPGLEGRPHSTLLLITDTATPSKLGLHATGEAEVPLRVRRERAIVVKKEDNIMV